MKSHNNHHRITMLTHVKGEKELTHFFPGHHPGLLHFMPPKGTRLNGALSGFTSPSYCPRQLVNYTSDRAVRARRGPQWLFYLNGLISRRERRASCFVLRGAEENRAFVSCTCSKCLLLTRVRESPAAQSSALKSHHKMSLVWQGMGINVTVQIR